MVTLSKTYLATLPTGNTTVTFNFSAGSSQTLAITISDSTSGTQDECFIATAAFGSKFTWPVALLRHFRDQYLLTNTPGQAFVRFYYKHSPPIAALIASSQPFKILVRVLLAPIIALVYIVYHPALIGMVLVFLMILFAYQKRIRRKPLCD